MHVINLKPSPLPLPHSVEKLSSMKPVPGAKKVGGHCTRQLKKKKTQVMFIVSLNMVLVNQNRFPHNQRGGGDEKKRRKAQRRFLSISFHLALKPTLPLGGLLLYSTVLFVRHVGIFLQSLHLPLQWHRFPELHSLRKKSPTWLDSLGAQRLGFKLWKCYIQIHSTFNMSFLSCCLKTERAASEHAIPPI